jgi:hypothetical protein
MRSGLLLDSHKDDLTSANPLMTNLLQGSRRMAAQGPGCVKTLGNHSNYNDSRFIEMFVLIKSMI